MTGNWLPVNGSVEFSKFFSPPAEPGVYLKEIILLLCQPRKADGLPPFQVWKTPTAWKNGGFKSHELQITNDRAFFRPPAAKLAITARIRKNGIFSTRQKGDERCKEEEGGIDLLLGNNMPRADRKTIQTDQII